MRDLAGSTVSALLLCTLCGCSGGEGPGGSESREPPPADTAPAATTVEGIRSFRGMMTHLVEAPRFTDCGTGASFVMAQEADYPAAERAYLEAEAQGEPLLVTFDGRVARRPEVEGGDVDAIVVTAFGGAEPEQGCGGDVVTAPLESTVWRLVALPGAADVPADAAATFFLDPDTRTSAGSTGCNRYTGAYRLDGGRLAVGVAAVTRMACPPAHAALETDFLEALRVSGAFRFRDGFLELLGEAGPVARFAPPEG